MGRQTARGEPERVVNANAPLVGPTRVDAGFGLMAAERGLADQGPTARGFAALALMAASAGITLWIELQLFDLRVFFHWDVWFNADTNWNLLGFASDGSSNLTHPFYAPVIAAVVTLGARAVTALGLSDSSLDFVRTWLALMVVPILAAGRTLLVFHLVRRLTSRLVIVALICLLDVAAFATITTGSVPGSYPFTAACIAAMYLLLVDDTPRAAWVRPGLWVLVGAAAIGVTITNAIPLATLLGADLYRRRVPIRRAAALVAAVLALDTGVGFAVWLVDVRMREDPLSISEAATVNERLHRPSPAAAREIGWMMAYSFLAPRPTPAETWTTSAHNPDYLMQFSFGPLYGHGWGSWWRALVTLGMLALGIAGYVRHPNAVPWLVAPLLVVAENFGLHLFYGDHFARYALHWTTSLVWLIAGVALLPGRLQRVGTVALAAFVALTAVNSASLLHGMLSSLRSW